jgi:hypothetical protein
VYRAVSDTGHPLTYHYSWHRTTTVAGKPYPADVFDIRTLPDFFERPPYLGQLDIPFEDWQSRRDTDMAQILVNYIKDCLAHDIRPWRKSRPPSVISAVLRALRRDVSWWVSAAQLIWFPSRKDRLWQEAHTAIGSHLGIEHLPNGNILVNNADGQHWRISLEREYAASIAPSIALREFQCFLKRTMGQDVPIKSAHFYSQGEGALPIEQFTPISHAIQQALGLPLATIDSIPDTNGGGFVLRLGDSPESLRQTLVYCWFLHILNPQDAPPKDP